MADLEFKDIRETSLDKIIESRDYEAISTSKQTGRKILVRRGGVIVRR